MTAKKKRPATTITDRFIRIVCRRLRENKRVRRSLPVWGRIHIDRRLPFLCVYRRPASGDDAGAERLATSEASYLICSGGRRLQPGLAELVGGVTETMVEQFGGCLVLELWSGPPLINTGAVALGNLQPEFRIVSPKGAANDAMTEEFEEALSSVKLFKRKATVRTSNAAKCCPKNLPPLLAGAAGAEKGCYVFGLEIAPVYRDPQSGAVYPDVLRKLRHQLTRALRRTFFEFARKHTTQRPPHYHALGRRAVVKAVWEADRLLAEVSDSFDFLLQVTPVNTQPAWLEFQRNRFERQPAFHYRPLPAEPIVLKRNLYRTPVERIEDPALGQIFREKVDELDRQINMLQDRNTRRFLHESIQLFGGIEDPLYELATQILDKVPAHSRDEAVKGQLTPEQFAQRANEEIAFLRRQHPGLTATVEIRDDVSTLMVSRGSLLISTQSRIPASRVEALIQHEVGTHVLTYHNGRAQRFRQLYTGLAGYDAFQEGLAVLSEYLVGGLSRPRLRLLAARVIAARRLIEGATFVETFRELDRTWEFTQRTAFQVTMRTYRGGGLTKDAVYLRGLCQILDYFKGGGELEPLLVGKIAVQHIPIIRELQWRGVLRAPPLSPRYMSQPDAMARVEKLRNGVTVLQLVERKRK